MFCNPALVTLHTPKLAKTKTITNMAPLDENCVLSEEDYLVSRAKEELKRDQFAARAWMLTAKSLFPNNFNVQFEAYNIEKVTKHVKEAAQCFSTIFQQFEHEPLLWQEVQALTLQGNDNPDADFLKEMFSHIPEEVQQRVLVATADRSEDTMEQCRILHLLLRKFPHTAPHHAPKLVELLLAAERHSTSPINLYRQFLVCQVLPLVGQNKSVQIPPKLLFKLLHKAIDFYCSFLISPNKTWQEEEGIEDPWQGLFSVQQLLGQKLGWTLSTPSPNSNNKDSFWQKLRHFAQTHTLEGSGGTVAADVKEIVYCATTFLLLCLHEYSAALAGTLGSGVTGAGSQGSSQQQEIPLLLVEGFVETSYSSQVGPSAAKRARLMSSEEEHGGPAISVSAQAAPAARQSLVQTLLVAARTWDLLHSFDSTKREFARLQQQLRLNESPWFQTFLNDEALLRGRDVAPKRSPQQVFNLSKCLRLVSAALCAKRYSEASMHAVNIVVNLPSAPVGQLSASLRRTAPSGRHLHFLALSRLEVLQYCTKVFIVCLQQGLQGPSGETALGHCLVLLQLDWPQEQEFASLLLEQIRSVGRFSYPLFARYIVNVDLLEEFMYLASEQGGRVSLDVLASSASQLSSQRRIATRGVDKGAKEDFRQAMRRQVARGSENIENLIKQFVTLEKLTL